MSIVKKMIWPLYLEVEDVILIYHTQCFYFMWKAQGFLHGYIENTWKPCAFHNSNICKNELWNAQGSLHGYVKKI